MSSVSDTWSCRISLRFEYDDRGTPLPASTTHEFGAILTNKNQFEICVRRAQAAVLNPHLPHDTFVKKTVQELKDATQSDSCLKFSKNTVCVDITDPEATSLSFSDLPGVLDNLSPQLRADNSGSRLDTQRNTGHNRSSAKLSRGIYRASQNSDSYYHSYEWCVVMYDTQNWSDMTFTDDMENQQAVRLARLADPEGERTIGWLSNPMIDLFCLR
jgi:vacuolar protein sorting-associated protein 1